MRTEDYIFFIYTGVMLLILFIHRRAALNGSETHFVLHTNSSIMREFFVGFIRVIKPFLYLSIVPALLMLINIEFGFKILIAIIFVGVLLASSFAFYKLFHINSIIMASPTILISTLYVFYIIAYIKILFVGGSIFK